MISISWASYMSSSISSESLLSSSASRSKSSSRLDRYSASKLFPPEDRGIKSCSDSFLPLFCAKRPPRPPPRPPRAAPRLPPRAPPRPPPRPCRALCMAFCRALCLIGGGPVGLEDFDLRFAAALARRCWQGRDIATAVFGGGIVGMPNYTLCAQRQSSRRSAPRLPNRHPEIALSPPAHVQPNFMDPDASTAVKTVTGCVMGRFTVSRNARRTAQHSLTEMRRLVCTSCSCHSQSSRPVLLSFHSKTSAKATNETDLYQ